MKKQDKDTIKTKICSSCELEKNISEFRKKKQTKDGWSNQCKPCVKGYEREYYHSNNGKLRNNKTYMKLWRENNKEYAKEYYKFNTSKFKKYHKKWVSNNKKKNKEYQKIWNVENKKHINLYKLQKYHSDPKYKLHLILRCRINQAISKYNFEKKDTSIKELGCSIQEYVLYLEQQFDKNMNWDNYGTYWEIDHIYPLSKGGSFHYTNTQPLTIEENRKKGNSIIK